MSRSWAAIRLRRTDQPGTVAQTGPSRAIINRKHCFPQYENKVGAYARITGFEWRLKLAANGV
jgi:hypothetical protein